MKRDILLLLLAIIALTVISWDYTSGHTIDDIVNQTYCPICDAFQSTELGVLLLYIVMLIGLVPVLCFFMGDNTLFIPSLVQVSITPSRAPPLSA